MEVQPISVMPQGDGHRWRKKGRNMFRKLVNTDNDVLLTVLRLVLGIVFFAHGAQKLLGWFGGAGFTGTMDVFTQRMGIPAPLALLPIAAEFFGGLGLIVGLLGRVAAFGIISDMLVAVVMVHAHFGFFMNWYGNQQGEGIEYHLLAITLGLAVVVRGSGALSCDRLLSRLSDESSGQVKREQAATLRAVR
jgi:putative oxidoreductase